MSSTMLEELEMKEPTPSIAPSQSENVPYAKKWRVLLAVLLGVTIVGICLLGFYLSTKTRTKYYVQAEIQAAANKTTTPKPDIRWRHTTDSCPSVTNRTCPEGYNPVPLLVIGIDGLHPDFVNPDVTPALSYLKRCGVTADSLVPTYPTTTFPNFYSIGTGLYPESHGIIGNNMYDPKTKKEFKDTRYNSDWWHGDPIWNTVKKQNKMSSVYNWPGSDVTINGMNANNYFPYRKNEPIDVRTRQVQNWLTSPADERPDIIMVYFEKPMSAIQEFGPFSDEAKYSLSLVDKEIEKLMIALNNTNLVQCLNILVVSDHGAATASCSSSFYLESFFPNITKKAEVFTGAVGRLRAASGDKAVEEEILSVSQCKNPRVRVLPKYLLPRRYHYANNDRIEEVILDTKPDTRIVVDTKNYCKKGEHGFNNLEPSMQATFIGFGPDLKVNYTARSFRNVELYNLMSHLIKVKPSPNNGTLGSLDHLLRHMPKRSPRDTHKNLLEEEILPLINRRKVPDNATEETCMCIFVEQVEPEVDYVTANISSNSTNNATETEDYDDSANAMSEEELKVYLFHQQNYHNPWGLVGYSNPDHLQGKMKILLHSDYVIGLQEQLNLGLWVSFTINKTIVTGNEDPDKNEDTEVNQEKTERPPPCWQADQRLERLQEDQCDNILNSQSYKDKEITLMQLYPEELETQELLAAEGYLLSNMAPMKAGYMKGAYKAMIGAIQWWAANKGGINVVLGPVFDYDLNGKKDNMPDVMKTVIPLVPSDYYLVITSCNGSPVTKCPVEQLDVLPFVFPNSDVQDNCFMSDMEYLHYHLTTVKDIELLTGLRFFRNVNIRDRVILKTVQPTAVWDLPAERATTRKVNNRNGKSENIPVEEVNAE
ncbi:venom phosphodiesterase-like [Penaeus chinensis]|uniref:venom phosphodiesterase-like n=1 Tax=Penaeus chinensis TaxID=139456 RepID=UPI001FB84C75|nr:venom phosphodiesterase-like [Penaeus chinensis]